MVLHLRLLPTVGVERSPCLSRAPPLVTPFSQVSAACYSAASAQPHTSTHSDTTPLPFLSLPLQQVCVVAHAWRSWSLLEAPLCCVAQPME